MHYLKHFCMRAGLPDTATPERFPEKRFDIYTPEPDLEEARATVLKFWGELPDPYVNTSLHGKSYIRALAEAGARFVYLHRPIMDTAHSWYQMGGAPGRPGRGYAYHPHPGYDGNLLRLPGRWEDYHDFELCVWLCLETRARAQFSSSQAELYGAPISELNTINGMLRLLRWLGAPNPDACDFNDIGWKAEPLTNSSRSLAVRPPLPLTQRLAMLLRIRDMYDIEVGAENEMGSYER